jgi:hypothetical protein
MKELYDAANAGVPSPVTASGCPVSSLREVQLDGTDVLIGSCALIRSGFHEVPETDERERSKKENNARPVGNPHIIWSFGGMLPSSIIQGMATEIFN